MTSESHLLKYPSIQQPTSWLFEASSVKQTVHVEQHRCDQLESSALTLKQTSFSVAISSGAREPWGEGDQMTPRNLPGVKHGILTPIFFWKVIFSGTHSHVVIEDTFILYSESRPMSVFVSIYNRFVALMIVTRPSQKIVPARLPQRLREVSAACSAFIQTADTKWTHNVRIRELPFQFAQ